MRREVLLAEFANTPWAVEERYLLGMASVLARWGAGTPSAEDTLAQIRATREADTGRRQATARAAGGAIAVIPVLGVISQRASLIQEYSGGTACTQLAAQLREAMADDSIAQVLLDIHSPGGSVYGIQELSAEIMAMPKPIVAVANSLCASAAYWIAASCTEVYCTPGGEVGSIGVWQAHTDESKAVEKAGVNVTLITAGKFKTEGNPYGPLPTEAREFMQSRTNDYYRAFTGAVARGRGVPVATVRSGMGEGRVLGAESALREKMIDGIASIDQVIAGMRRNIGRGAVGARAQQSARLISAQPEQWQLAAQARQREIDILEAGG